MIKKTFEIYRIWDPTYNEFIERPFLTKHQAKKKLNIIVENSKIRQDILRQQFEMHNYPDFVEGEYAENGIEKLEIVKFIATEEVEK